MKTKAPALTLAILIGAGFHLRSEVAISPLEAPFNQASFLPGASEIREASARPAARAYFLLYAAALEQFATDKAKLLASEPVLAGLVRREFDEILTYFKNYEIHYGKFAPIVDARREAEVLERFLGKGYRGKLRQDFERYIAELRKAEIP